MNPRRQTQDCVNNAGMGLHEDMQRQQAALDAEAKQRVAAEEARNRQLRDEASEKRRFLDDFVNEARARGVKPSPIPYYSKGLYNTGPTREKRSRTDGWVVYLWRSGHAKYAIGVDGVLYECGFSKRLKPVAQEYFHRVPWPELTRVLLGHPPATEPPND
jgi:hypothetical protein